ncbi:uracil-DNA glycosylase [Buchnera aphidicola (Nipponaphis monzeni)]|uniref:Uracil-DNA glycosylase n=1 Tax=Buchnera aphidicola (Nipponaphis monzeni) TaxID=2495405 RepID=A0A455TA10_9GAMM|nr:uracil-DNA glycosylase [Buchnera aphidicola]BBI01164.1 uracil-DNA glycosylase [Buchnera aphidicola (Nipponaphis monzeni)]
MFYIKKKKSYFKQIIHFLNRERLTKNIFPSKKNVFKAFKLTPFYKIKVVIIGQDPYYNCNQADGLSFSVFENTPIPPSLKNIFLELRSDISNFYVPDNGCLQNWSAQGVFLLNTILTVEQGKPGSHAKIGWLRFTNQVIKLINNYHRGVIFLLWGKYAVNKMKMINSDRHYILKSAHPSPLSAYRGFFGCRHFSSVNKILKSIGRKPIIW